ncbi:MAG: hypothetical protein IJX10_06415 [Phascolarctobacterium sp.]|nr:hypothetical protein [Phascolarctobacterium sp.]
MYVKKVLSLLAGCLLFANAALAQEVTVDGVGIDKDSAVRDAMRNAVENVIGTYIDSRTLVDKSVVALDEIYAKSQGFVKNINILDEAELSGEYRVKARIDVDTNPDAQLMNKLNMIMLLNDPRIAVVVEYYDDSKGRVRSKYPTICEATMNNKLIELGFNHVVDSGVIKDERQNVMTRNGETDYIAFGRLDINTEGVNIPSYRDLANGSSYNPSVSTGLVKSLAELDVKIMKTDTQEIIGNFRVEANGMQGNANNTENQAVKQLGISAAENLRKVFSMKAANVSKYMRVIVRTDNQDNIYKLEAALKEIGGVNEAFIRSYDNGKGIIEVDSDLKPTQIYRGLRDNYSLFMEKATENTLEVSM